ncbi:cytochrome c oxidase assembly protein COX16 homolog, mitochondrial [Schistocerca serialis cubense]|uniref:cytochrome c oxidase assembly protein COX16 homolog, mitochondrial n=1 Tax=Schistocerca cancellata TaxID=274614 RepID=UPI0021176DD9|nr:cytochrome c oxidase assembly protein COX16 homolog, mitochondrial [Schistocerca cancellata]XP_049937945.1 cytochrome c oxidase assembly protein COX16 homolog, mitochondrial [Schistocerca serialis cubense]
MGSKNKFLRYGLPFVTMVVVGSFGLKEFSEVRYKFRKFMPLKPEEVEKANIKMKKPGEVTLESEYEKLKQIDIDNWQSIRGPRPWEEDTLPKKDKKSA